ncbi:hypothetical protein EPA93_24580 [Ktedonosporobacter rubrisoli]|uniref:VOC domain-containing protein n=1 Tax=Ktedonosporobacter rubrisoli TaxID=2509675 RepID=A0A4P6JTT1_KTERU|nr:VOC family protein [Ktedonosporobacter rubrisoli]QBD78987.1 hypothetical protein EPA93_24580 [Ktedonosporobacter rubrisoli]
MHIQELVLYTSSLASQKQFYSQALGLSLVDERPDSFTVQAGLTRLSFHETKQNVLYHIAFTIPRNKFARAKDWLVRQQIPFLRKDGEDEIFFDNINARSCYFPDPDNNILEFIVHYNLARETDGDFSPADVLHVSEIGLPVEDVPALATKFEETLGLKPYGGPVSEGFAFMGDITGQLVVTKIGRPWLPTLTVPAAPSPVQVTLSGTRKQWLDLAPYPYILTAHQ